MHNTSMPKTATNDSKTDSKADPIDDGPNLDQIHETLSESRRRHVLRTLYHKGSIHKKELAKYVAALEEEKPVSEVSDKEHKRIVVSLHQAHLPYLAKHQIVVWDQSTNAVSLGPYSDRVLRYMDGINVREGTNPNPRRSFADRVAATVPNIF